jgi:hypothetical protein
LPLPVEERLPYGRRRFCQFLLLIVILLMIFGDLDDFSQDQEQDQEYEQEGETYPALPDGVVYGITGRP